ncbi:MAG TPA: zf-TFIIB domain-containing protein [Pyrinomonadaceae bacterium]|nr:zf-TFIIB domain-containing protein [Pyrinomonadaceae bacterium]
MLAITLGASAMRECGSCGGLWLEVAAFEKICADREHQSSVLGMPSPVVEHQIHPAKEIRVRYIPCPQCRQLMNRMNFARCSGVIVDICRGHGIWFDRDELRSIIEFIRAGGLELARNKEKRQIAFEREQLRRDQSLSNAGIRANYSDAELLDGFSASRGMLKFLIE